MEEGRGREDGGGGRGGGGGGGGKEEEERGMEEGRCEGWVQTPHVLYIQARLTMH